MANPNIAAATSILGTTTYLTPSGTSAVVLLPNAASSGKVLKINSLIAANVDGTTAADATVSYYTNGAVAQGSAPSGGTFPAVDHVRRRTVPVHQAAASSESAGRMRPCGLCCVPRYSPFTGGTARV
jgi:hypothetical protein